MQKLFVKKLIYFINKDINFLNREIKKMKTAQRSSGSTTKLVTEFIRKFVNQLVKELNKYFEINVKNEVKSKKHFGKKSD